MQYCRKSPLGHRELRGYRAGSRSWKVCRFPWEIIFQRTQLPRLSQRLTVKCGDAPPLGSLCIPPLGRQGSGLLASVSHHPFLRKHFKRLPSWTVCFSKAGGPSYSGAVGGLHEGYEHPRELEVLVPQSCLTLCDLRDCSLPGSPVRGILQARILEWVATPFSRESSKLRDRTQVSHIAGRSFTI